MTVRRSTVRSTSGTVRSTSRDVFTYPDVSVVCGEVALYAGSSDVVTNPKVVFEVLSEYRAVRSGRKAEAYRTLPSLFEHVLVVQHRPHLECYARQSDGGRVLRESGAGGEITIASLSLPLEVDEVYRGVFDLPG